MNKNKNKSPMKRRLEWTMTSPVRDTKKPRRRHTPRYEVQTTAHSCAQTAVRNAWLWRQMDEGYAACPWTDSQLMDKMQCTPEHGTEDENLTRWLEATWSQDNVYCTNSHSTLAHWFQRGGAAIVRLSIPFWDTMECRDHFVFMFRDGDELRICNTITQKDKYTHRTWSLDCRWSWFKKSWLYPTSYNWVTKTNDLVGANEPHFWLISRRDLPNPHTYFSDLCASSEYDLRRRRQQHHAPQGQEATEATEAAAAADGDDREGTDAVH
jgi:hypothetical protein